MAELLGHTEIISFYIFHSFDCNILQNRIKGEKEIKVVIAGIFCVFYVISIYANK